MDLGAAVKPAFTREELPWLLELLEGLERDGLVALEGESQGDPARFKASLP